MWRGDVNYLRTHWPPRGLQQREFMILLGGGAACRSRRALLATAPAAVYRNPQPAAGVGDRFMEQTWPPFKPRPRGIWASDQCSWLRQIKIPTTREFLPAFP